MSLRVFATVVVLMIAMVAASKCGSFCVPGYPCKDVSGSNCTLCLNWQCMTTNINTCGAPCKNNDMCGRGGCFQCIYGKCSPAPKCGDACEENTGMCDTGDCFQCMNGTCGVPPPPTQQLTLKH
jgi:hypothetical protein